MLGSLFNKLAGLQACCFIKKRLQHRRFPVNFVKFYSKVPSLTIADVKVDISLCFRTVPYEINNDWAFLNPITVFLILELMKNSSSYVKIYKFLCKSFE